ICTVYKQNISLGIRRKQAGVSPRRCSRSALSTRRRQPLVAAANEHCGKIPFEIPTHCVSPDWGYAAGYHGYLRATNDMDIWSHAHASRESALCFCECNALSARPGPKVGPLGTQAACQAACAGMPDGEEYRLAS